MNKIRVATSRKACASVERGEARKGGPRGSPFSGQNNFDYFIDLRAGETTRRI
jgi:hypothetical protein